MYGNSVVHIYYVCHIAQRVTILPGHATYEQLEEPTLPLWKSVYFFNLTNPEGFAEGETPRVEEIGPYAYRSAPIVYTSFFCHFSLSPSSVSLNCLSW